MTSKRNVVYTIQIVGRLWLPAQKVAMDMEIYERDWNVVDSDFQNLTLDEIEHYIMTHTSDLSQVIDFTVDKHEEKGVAREIARRGAPSISSISEVGVG